MKKITARKLIHKIRAAYWDATSYGASVLTFHQVNDREEEWDIWHTAITFAHFKECISLMESKGIKFVPLSKLDEGDVEERNVVSLTFDDGYLEVYQYAYPFLKEKNIPFTVFATLNFLGHEGHLTSKQLFDMSQDPLCTIGSHCIHHVSLRRLTDERCREEIERSKKMLEERIGRSVDYLAYPFGNMENVSKREIAFARENYKLAFSTMNSRLSIKRYEKNRYILPRINVADYSYKKMLDKYFGFNNQEET